LVIEADGSQDTDLWRHNIGGIQSAAHAGFEDCDIDLLVSEMGKSQHGCQFKKSGCNGKVGDSSAELGEEEGEGRVGDRFAIDADAFPKVDEMRGCVEARREAGGLAGSVEQSADRAFSVRACDVQAGELEGVGLGKKLEE
jgi:hypothetical protein